MKFQPYSPDEDGLVALKKVGNSWDDDSIVLCDYTGMVSTENKSISEDDILASTLQSIVNKNAPKRMGKNSTANASVTDRTASTSAADDVIMMGIAFTQST